MHRTSHAIQPHNVAGVRAVQCPEQTFTQLQLNQQETPPASSCYSGQCLGPASAHLGDKNQGYGIRGT